MSIQTLAVLSDIHGNRWALEAVLQEIARQGVDRIVNLGDSLYGPLDPVGTARILMKNDILSVRGNEDHILIDADAEAIHAPSLAFVKSLLGDKEMDWIQGLSSSVTLEETFFLCHGTPDRDDVYLLKAVGPDGAHPRSVEVIEEDVAELSTPVVLCGHDHTPQIVTLPRGGLVVNPGSVGLPAYCDTWPYPHAMATGSPHARYALLWRQGETWQAEIQTVAYDWDHAAEVALKNGRPDWVSWLKTGKV